MWKEELAILFSFVSEKKYADRIKIFLFCSFDLLTVCIC